MSRLLSHAETFSPWAFECRQRSTRSDDFQLNVLSWKSLLYSQIYRKDTGEILYCVESNVLPYYSNQPFPRIRGR